MHQAILKEEEDAQQLELERADREEAGKPMIIQDLHIERVLDDAADMPFSYPVPYQA